MDKGLKGSPSGMVFGRSFDPKEWEVTGRAGEFLLIRGIRIRKVDLPAEGVETSRKILIIRSLSDTQKLL